MEILARVVEDSESKFRYQSLSNHLQNVEMICSDFCKNFSTIAKLLGYSHDLGKASFAFQNKLKNRDAQFVDHSSIGAIFLLKKREGCKSGEVKLMLQICAFVVACHHKGLCDLVKNGESELTSLLNKLNDKAFKKNYDDSLSFGKSYCEKIEEIIDSVEFRNDCVKFVDNIRNTHGKSLEDINFFIGFYIRYFYSSLIDADRIDAGNFEIGKIYEENAKKEAEILKNFEKIAEILDKKIESFPQNELNSIRKEIYKSCIDGAGANENIFNLNVQTGGGKTFASFRFALERAKLKKLPKIIYVVPYISIIEQNAQSIRDILGKANLEDMLIESHCNAISVEEEDNREEYDDSKFKFLSTWNEPIIFTTMVGFLESVYGDSTSNNRRLHNLQNSVIIFDEVQSLPINCIGLFNLLIKFLTQDLNCTAVLSTATQPVLDNLSTYCSSKDAEFIQLEKSKSLVEKEFPILERTQIIYKNSVGINKEQAVNFVIEKLKENNNLLFVVNTKNAAKELFLGLRDEVQCFHLSTNMCPEHRLNVIETVRKKLKYKEKFVLISTQLIEAGVDLDFECAIRSQAGLESIIQTAGRCNREGKLVDSSGARRKGSVYVLKLDSGLENLDNLPDIAFRQNGFVSTMANNLNAQPSKQLIEKYFKNLYSGSTEEKEYSIKKFNTSAVKLLTCTVEKVNDSEFKDLKQQFGTVGKYFKVINNQNQVGVLVNFEKGGQFIEDLCAGRKVNLRQIQRYMVNVFDNSLEKFNCQSEEDLIYSFSYDKDLGLVENKDYSPVEGGNCI